MQPRIGDAFGLDLLEYLNGEQAIEVIEREDGYIDTLPIADYFTEFKKWPSIERKAIRYATGHVLDIGCGAGRHSLYLQRKGLIVTGIDASPGAVSVCRRRGVKDARNVRIEQVRTLTPLIFDTVILFGHNLGLLGSKEKGRRILQLLHNMTSPEARILGTTLDAGKTQNPEHRRYQRWNVERGRMPGQIKIRVRHECIATPWFDYLFTSENELEDLLNGTGWMLKRTFHEGEHLSAVIEKVYGR
jgi:SAM-dependent methyltransferase